MFDKEAAKDSFRKVLSKFSIKKHKAELEELDHRTTFIEEEPEEAVPDDIIEEGTYSQDKRLKKGASKVRGINIISLPVFLKRDCDKEYSYVNLLLHFLVAFLVIVAIGWIFKLKLIPVVILCFVYLLFGPSLIYFHHRKKYEISLFAECARYIEQMLYSFTRKTKILTALKETRLVVHGRLGTAIDFAINKIQTGTNYTGDVYSAALKEIEALLPCSRVKNLHEFLAEVENVGGRHLTALEIMLDDLREWDVRTGQFQQNQAVKGMGMLLAILMSLGTCLFMTSVLPADMGGDISGFGAYQWVTTITLIVMFFIYRVAARKLTHSWVADDFEVDQESIDADIKRINDYMETGKGVKPIFAINRIQNELEKKFPRWVMRFALLASTQSIPSALRNSIASCPNVMRHELEKLIVAIDENPTGVEPYVDFFSFVDMPQLRSMMLMVYSLSEYSTKDIDKHVLSIVKRNYAMQATAEKIQNEESLAKFSLYVTLPMILACVVMMVDVAMIVINMITYVSTDIAGGIGG